jgi:hypothetical protein
MLLILNKPRASLSLRTNALLIAVFLATASINTSAQMTTVGAGFDERYSARLPSNLRPLNIFNDGVNTFIEPRKGQKLSIDGAVQDGPYLVVRGLPAEISVSGYPVFRVDATGKPLYTPIAAQQPAPVVAPAPIQAIATANVPALPTQERIATLLSEMRQKAVEKTIPKPAISEPLITLPPFVSKTVEADKSTQSVIAKPTLSRDGKYPIFTFEVRKRDDLSETLPRWAAEHGVDVVWQLPKPFIVQQASKSEAISAMSALDATLQIHQLKAMAVQGVNTLVVTEAIKGN